MKGQYVDANKACEMNIGYTVDELKKFHFTHILPEGVVKDLLGTRDQFIRSELSYIIHSILNRSN